MMSVQNTTNKKEILKNIGETPDSITVASITDLPVKTDKALIEADVALQYVHARPKQSLKSGPIKLDTLEGSVGSDSGSPWPLIQQSDLTKVIRGPKLANL